MSAPVEIEELHRCPTCHKGYKRREHLIRHQNSHNDERPYVCRKCDSSFKRTDTLRRHTESCDGKRSHQTTVSRRRRACDRCVRQKKACDAASPCQNCLKRGLSCQNSFLRFTSTPSSASADDSTAASDVSWGPDGTTTTLGASDIASQPLGMSFGENWTALVNETVSDFNLMDHNMIGTLSQEWQDLMAPLCGTTDFINSRPQPQPMAIAPSGYSFHFLADFTSRSGLVGSFDCGTLAQRREVVSSYYQSYMETEGVMATPSSLRSGDTGGASAEFGDPDEDTFLVTADLSTVISGWQQSWLANPIVMKLQQIIIRIKEVVTVKPRNSSVTLSWSPAIERRCLHFFSVERIGKFLELYWSCWHPNVNFLHRPTFNPVNTPTTLLAAMALIGACVSPDSEDSEDAKLWFNCVEEMVFTDDHLCSDPIFNGTDDEPVICPILASRRKLQALQAAYIVCLYQNWEGSDTSKRRIRRYRFGTVVSVARDIGVSTARHADYSSQPEHEFVWAEYVAREEMIRTFIWIQLLDSAFVIFNNLPPKMVIKEMTMRMASPEYCFQATTSESCREQILRWLPDANAVGNLMLREAIENLCIRKLSVEAIHKVAELGLLDLFAIISAFHYIIFQQQNLTGVEGQLIPIRNALHNWKAVWDVYRTRISSDPLNEKAGSHVEAHDMWKRLGFTRYCPEYWLLANLLVNKMSAAILQQQQLNKPGTMDGNGELYSARIVEPVLDKYDQTSMRQVNDLITSFRSFEL